jgi:hypothetical protein
MLGGEFVGDGARGTGSICTVPASSSLRRHAETSGREVGLCMVSIRSGTAAVIKTVYTMERI